MGERGQPGRVQTGDEQADRDPDRLARLVRLGLVLAGVHREDHQEHRCLLEE